MLNYINRFCCNIIWGWTQEFEAKNEAPDVNENLYYVNIHPAEQLRAEEVCWQMSANRCNHEGIVLRSTCSRAHARWLY